MDKVVLQGIEIHYLTKGEGKPILFLHGFPDSSAVWRKQVDEFANLGYRVIVPDVRGYGLSSKPSEISAYKTKKTAQDIYGLLDHLGVKRVLLVGHDWGAALAWSIASSTPDRVEALAVLSTGHGLATFTAGGIPQRQKMWYCLFFLQPDAEEAIKANGWALWRELMASEDPQLVEDQIRRMLEPGALSAGLAWYRANITAGWFAMTEPLAMPKLQLPVLGLWSSRDCFLTEEQMKGSARFVEEGKFTYKKIEGVGHWMQLEAPKEVNQSLLHFFRSLSGQSAL